MSLSSLITLTSCVDRDPAEVRPVMVTALAPQFGAPGSGLSISGIGFGIEGERDQVTLSGTRLEVIYWSAERIDCRIPREMRSGHHVLVVSANEYVSEAQHFEVVSEARRGLDLDQGSDAESRLRLDVEVDLDSEAID